MARYNRDQVLELLDGPEDDIDSGDEFDGYVDDTEMMQVMDANEGNDDNDEVEIEETNGEMMTENSDCIDSDGCFSSEASRNQDFVEGPACSLDMSNKTPIDYFQLLMTDSILDHIVSQTNLYADQHFEANPDIPRKSRLHTWKKKIHNITELLQFIAILIIMGIIHYPRIEDYWVKTWPFGTNAFSRVMTRDRFSVILKFIHLNDNKKSKRKGEPGYDPLFKIRPFLVPLLSNFQFAYNPGRELAVDESMVSFKGRIWFIQYLPKKPNKWGLKAYVLADSKTGYTYNWSLYTGKCYSVYSPFFLNITM